MKTSGPVCTYFMEGLYLTVYTWATKADLNQLKISLQITTKIFAKEDFMCIFQLNC